MDQSTVLQEVAVTLSDEQEHVLVQPSGSVERTLPTDYDPEKAELKFDLPDSVEAPVQAGQKLGTVTLMYEGENYGSLDLLTVNDVARSDRQYYIKLVQDYLATWWVRAIIAAVVVLVLAVMFYRNVVVPRRRKRYGRSANRRTHYSGNRRKKRRF